MSDSPYEVYMDYLALKLHFSDKSYDYRKYGGKLPAKYSTYSNRHDKTFFEKLSKKQNCHEILLASLSNDPDMWIGDIVENDEVYKKWKRIQKSMDYIFTEDIKKLDFSDLNSNFVVVNGEYPKLLEMYQHGEIHKETLIILNYIFKFTNNWNKNISDTIVWPKIYLNLKKYSSFMNVNPAKYKELFKKHFEKY